MKLTVNFKSQKHAFPNSGSKSSESYFVTNFSHVFPQKAARKSKGRTSLGGVQELFKTPAKSVPSPSSAASTPASAGTPDSVLYAQIPDTPEGPGEMFVSPLSAEKTRKSMSLVGVKELFRGRGKSKSPASPSGIRRLMKTPPSAKPAPATPSPTGVARLFTTPKSQVKLINFATFLDCSKQSWVKRLHMEFLGVGINILKLGQFFVHLKRFLL